MNKNLLQLTKLHRYRKRKYITHY